ncbi:sulfotransferase family 2 domain-containing protein [Falsihalocynthiibacter arcticus]|uniref:Gamma-glutamyl kinase n=1 Tax=Falsihalocynthiibacter arcticus TaxID=1579316 RepID=A0A126V3Q9_9RHOB|nr:sulfotransferase family 2 domain-containing protein [Falsihalocynthiibacter arcticus]AML52923.1 gamma-glutamyl kinase [Falsihalocynthiibacter arcticus]
MLVFWKQKLVFLAVPKTGTSAIEEALGPIADMRITNPPMFKHMPLVRFNTYIKPFILENFDVEIETVAVVRNPIDWLGSWYRYRSRPDLAGNPNSTAGMSFDTFVEGYLKNKKPAHSNVGSQAIFVSRHNGPIGVTHLFQYEQLDKLIEFLEARLNIGISLARTNQSPKGSVVLSSEMEERLRRKRTEEFAVWEVARR